MRSRTPRILLLSLLAITCTGCVRESTNGGSRIFQYALWVPGLILLGGLAAAAIGWTLRQKSGRFGWGFLIAGPVAALVFAPSMFLDRVTVDEAGFSRRSGLYGMTSVQDVKYSNVTEMRLITEEGRGRRGRKTINYYLMCDHKNGSSTKVPLGNGVIEAATPVILRAAGALGIPIIDQTGQIQ
jgi:hypothetical protein